MQKIRNIAAIAILFPCLVLTFQGFPLALISYLGFIGTLSAVTVLICAIFHPMNSPKSVRVGVLFFGVLILIGSIVLINLGGLTKIGIEFFDDQVDIWLADTGIILGLFGGIFNVDKSMKYIEN